MLSDNIKNLRTEKGYTQKELASLLHVTAQAVSRWENGDVEPSIGTLTEMAKIFGVSTDRIINGTSDEAVKSEEETIPEEPAPAAKVEAPTAPPTPATPPKPVLAVCEQCNKPIYDGNDIVRIEHHHMRGATTKTILCRKCDAENKKRAHDNAVEYGINQRKLSFIWGGVISGLLLALSLIITLSAGADTGIVIACAVVSVLVFPFVSCLFLKNNFIGDMVEEIASWGFVKFPGLIFTLDLDGIIWLLTVKLLFWILGFMLAAGATILGVLLGIFLSIFVYPFALKKSFDSPESSRYY